MSVSMEEQIHLLEAYFLENKFDLRPNIDEAFLALGADIASARGRPLSPELGPVTRASGSVRV